MDEYDNQARSYGIGAIEGTSKLSPNGIGEQLDALERNRETLVDRIGLLHSKLNPILSPEYEDHPNQSDKELTPGGLSPASERLLALNNSLHLIINNLIRLTDRVNL